MNRYTKSLFITLFIYIALGVSLIYSNSLPVTDKEQTTSKETPLKISIVQFQEPQKQIVKQPKPKEPIKKIEPPKKEKIIEKKKVVKKEPIKKPLPKPIEKKPTKVVKKVIPKKKEKLKEESKEVVKKEEIQPTNTPVPTLASTTPVIEKKITKQIIKPTPNKEQIEQQKKEYFSKIKQTIDKNKTYPRLAVKRGIEGLIKIKFTLSHTGELLSYNIIEGQRVFKRSVIKAIEESFPLIPPNNLFTSNIDLSLTLAYKLY